MAEMVENPIASIKCAYEGCEQVLEVPINVSFQLMDENDPRYEAQPGFTQYEIITDPDLSEVWSHVWAVHVYNGGKDES